MPIHVLHFEKMHGLGNDFILVERRNLPQNINEPLLSKILCNRHYGIGADGLIIVDFANKKEADFVWDYYNSDGSDAEMCGNGMRCFAKYVYERGLTDNNSFLVLTKAGIIKPQLEEDGTVTVCMGIPKLPSNIQEKLTLSGSEITYTYIEVGNPHCVMFLDKYPDDNFFFKLGPEIEINNQFPNRINVNFAQVLNKNTINLRVWERGAGATLACGTGACATLVASNINNLTEPRASVNLPGGTITVYWNKEDGNVYLNGEASFVYTGEFNLNTKLVSS